MENKVEFLVDDFALEEVLYDPQTSGGLLVSINKDDAKDALEELKKNKIDAKIVGQISKKYDKSIFIE